MRRFGLVYLILALLLFFSSIASAESLRGRYQMNSNNWRGYIDINISGNSLSGAGFFDTDPNGNRISIRFTITEGHVIYGDRQDALGISFRRSPGDQRWFAWFSVNRQFCAGYFTYGPDKYPWYAIRE
jgi:hypothetical protein